MITQNKVAAIFAVFLSQNALAGHCFLLTGLLLICQKLDKPPKIEEFLIVYHIPKLNPEDINSLNRTIRSNEIKTVIKSFASWESPEGDRVLNSIKISGKISSNSS